MRKKEIRKKRTIEPSGTITPQKDIFKFKSKNLGVFKEPKIRKTRSTRKKKNIIRATDKKTLWEKQRVNLNAPDQILRKTFFN